MVVSIMGLGKWQELRLETQGAARLWKAKEVGSKSRATKGVWEWNQDDIVPWKMDWEDKTGESLWVEDLAWGLSEKWWRPDPKQWQ